MNTSILPALKTCLTDGLADLHLLGQSADGDAIQPVQVFIGSLPQPEASKPFPCVILMPVSGHHGGGVENICITLICCVYNPETGDAEGAEQDLAASPAYSACTGNTHCTAVFSLCLTRGENSCAGKRPKQTRNPSFRRPCCRTGP